MTHCIARRIGGSFSPAFLAILLGGIACGPEFLFAQEKPAENQPPAEGAERQKLLGTWKVINTEYQGESQEKKYAAGGVSFTTSNRFHFTEKEVISWIYDPNAPKVTNAQYRKYRINERTEPKQIDMIETDFGSGVFPDIYAWEGELLKLRVGDTIAVDDDKKILDKRRPKNFITNKKTYGMVLTLERITGENVRIPERPRD